VRQNLSELTDLPQDKFDTCSLINRIHLVDDPVELLRKAHGAMRHEGILVVSIPQDYSPDRHLEHLRQSLEADGKFENLKHQAQTILEYENRFLARQIKMRSREDLRIALIEAGFSILDEQSGLVDGTFTLIVAQKS